MCLWIAQNIGSTFQLVQKLPTLEMHNFNNPNRKRTGQFITTIKLMVIYAVKAREEIVLI